MVGLPTGTVTFLFSDVEGSTQLLERLGDAYASELQEHRAIVREAVGSHGGEIVDQRGEETFAAFSDASAAVEAAIEIERRQAERPMRVRIGLHTGAPALTGEGYLGLDVHRAARICAAGHGRQVLLSTETRALVADRPAKDLGAYLLKGITQPEHLYQLLADGLPKDFAPLRVLPTAPATRRRRFRRVGTEPRSLEQLAWATRARLPAIPPDERPAVSRLATALLAAARSSAAARRFVASVDRRAIERDLESYRSAASASERASDAAGLAARRIALLDAVGERLDAAHEAAHRPEPASDEVEQATAALDAGLETARAAIGPFRVRSRRTRRRGVRRLAGEYLVVTFDETGIEHVSTFTTMTDARNFGTPSGLRSSRSSHPPSDFHSRLRDGDGYYGFGDGAP